jgi:hypothetical protein
VLLQEPLHVAGEVRGVGRAVGEREVVAVDADGAVGKRHDELGRLECSDFELSVVVDAGRFSVTIQKVD